MSTRPNSRCEQECGDSNAGVNNRPERPGSPSLNINSSSPSADTLTRGGRPLVKLPTIYSFTITRRSASLTEQKQRDCLDARATRTIIASLGSVSAQTAREDSRDFRPFI